VLSPFVLQGGAKFQSKSNLRSVLLGEHSEQWRTRIKGTILIYQRRSLFIVNTSRGEFRSIK